VPPQWVGIETLNHELTEGPPLSLQEDQRVARHCAHLAGVRHHELGGLDRLNSIYSPWMPDPIWQCGRIMNDIPGGARRTEYNVNGLRAPAVLLTVVAMTTSLFSPLPAAAASYVGDVFVPPGYSIAPEIPSGTYAGAIAFSFDSSLIPSAGTWLLNWGQLTSFSLNMGPASFDLADIAYGVSVSTEGSTGDNWGGCSGYIVPVCGLQFTGDTFVGFFSEFHVPQTANTGPWSVALGISYPLVNNELVLNYFPPGAPGYGAVSGFVGNVTAVPEPSASVMYLGGILAIAALFSTSARGHRGGQRSRNVNATSAHGSNVTSNFT